MIFIFMANDNEEWIGHCACQHEHENISSLSATVYGHHVVIIVQVLVITGKIQKFTSKSPLQTREL